MNSEEQAPGVSLLAEGELTEKILGAAFAVHNTLGSGFLEKVYENALVVELKKSAFEVVQQRAFPVKYSGVIVGDYCADLIVSGRVIVECKAIGGLEGAHEAQLLNYLRASRIQVGLLLNFGRPKLQYKRMVL
jgi:GxxExxY protein